MAIASACLSLTQVTQPLFHQFKTPTTTIANQSLSSSLTHFQHPKKLSFTILPCLASPFSLRSKPPRVSTPVLAILQDVVTDGINSVESFEDGSPQVQDSLKHSALRPCELYACNLPRNCGILELLQMFKPFGTVQSVEVSRNAETGVSKGCGYVTMSSLDEAKAAIAALDESDVGGREMRVRFSVEMNARRRNLVSLNSAPEKILFFESPHKLYVGNLARAVKLDDLRNHFNRFGIVTSAKLVHDCKVGQKRIYGFLSFSSAAERDAAVSLNGTEFCGRTLVVSKGLERKEP